MCALPKVVTLRDYQIHAVNSAENAWRRGDRATLVVSATGTGKTTEVAEILRREVGRGGRALVMAHRRELLDQLSDRALSFGLRVGLELGKSEASSEDDVVVSSIQTMSRRLIKFNPEDFTLIVVDEAHHICSPSYRWVLASFPDARVLGVTATPDRADGVALSTVFNSCSSRYEIAEAVAAGHLVPARGVRVEVAGMDLSKVRRRVMAKGERDVVDLHPKDLSRIVLDPLVVEGVTGPLVELAQDRRTVVFAVDIRHAKAIVTSLRARGCTAAHIDGKMPKGDRKEVLRAHREGAFQFLVNVMVLVEGYDDPGISCVAVARPTTSRVFWTQACGRGLRPDTGKVECLILDFVGASLQLDLAGPEDALAGALAGPMTRVGGSQPPAPAQEAVYTPPKGWRTKFATRMVKLVRGVGRGMRRLLIR